MIDVSDLCQKLTLPKPLSSNNLPLVNNSQQNYKNYCSNKVCNKCRSYLVRNYRDRTDRLWLMCSALARNKNCCQFESGPTLFTELKDPVGFCTNNPDETFT